jgi:anti-sigma-K factor RskA
MTEPLPHWGLTKYADTAAFERGEAYEVNPPPPRSDGSATHREVADQPKTFWQSVLNSKKAIVAAVYSAAAVFIGCVAADGGAFPTWQELVMAGVVAIAAHGTTYAVSNEKAGGRVG